MWVFTLHKLRQSEDISFWRGIEGFHQAHADAIVHAETQACLAITNWLAGEYEAVDSQNSEAEEKRLNELIGLLIADLT